MNNKIFKSILLLGVSVSCMVVSVSTYAYDGLSDHQNPESNYRKSLYASHGSKPHRSPKHCSGNTSQEPENNFSLSSNNVFVVVQDSPTTTSYNKIWEGISGNLIEPGRSLYIYSDIGNTGLLSDFSVDQSASEFSPEITFTSIDFDGLEEKVHFDEVMVRACKDKHCHREYKGSPQIVKVVISVAPEFNSGASCEYGEGVVFTDCVDPTWLGASAWEILDIDGTTDYPYFNGDNDFLIQWAEVDTEEVGHDVVLDVKFTDKSANGTFRFHPAGQYQDPRQTIDMTEYSTGTIEFDVRPLDWGSNTTGLFVTTECGWPCTSGEIPLGMPTLNEWTHYALKVSDILESTQDGEFDLSRIEIGFSIFPGWDDMNGVHFQIDNIRWVKGS